jgi:hypothetical protein
METFGISSRILRDQALVGEIMDKTISQLERKQEIGAFDI